MLFSSVCEDSTSAANYDPHLHALQENDLSLFFKVWPVREQHIIHTHTQMHKKNRKMRMREHDQCFVENDTLLNERAKGLAAD